MILCDNEVRDKVKQGVTYALEVIDDLEKEHGIRMYDHHKAILIGNLSISASIWGIRVLSEDKSK